MSEINDIPDIPDFLKLSTPKFTKPSDEERHMDKLKEICSGTDEEDAKVICEIFAERYPQIMLEAIGNRLENLVGISNKAKRIFNSLGGLE